MRDVRLKEGRLRADSSCVTSIDSPLRSAESGSVDGSLGAIFSAGRSGSTWLGSVVSSHPDIDYRFEPILRLRETPAFAELERELRHPTRALEVGDFFAALQGADPRVVKPPFLHAGEPGLRPAARGVLWAAARSSSKLSDRFARGLAAEPGANIVFKEVDRLYALNAVVQLPQISLVYLMRHPVAVVASHLKGSGLGLMPEGLAESLINTLADHAELAHYLDRIDTLSSAQVEALLWRARTERSLAAVETCPSSTVVFYEGLIAEPFIGAELALNALGFDMCDATRQFVATTVSGASRWRRLSYGELPVNSYFTVFRTPRPSDWRAAAEPELIAQVLDIVESSPAYERGMASGHWGA